MAPRPPGSRPLRTLLAALVASSVAVPVSGAARPSAVPAPAPVTLAPLRSPGPGPLAERYAVNRDGIRAAERMADGHGDRARAEALRLMAGPARQFLSFDGRNEGRTAEVVGDARRSSPPRSRPGAPSWRSATGSPVSCTMWSLTICR